MADGLTTQTSALSTVPDATKFATDDAGVPGHIPIGKLAISTDGSATLIPADATNGLDVDVTRLPALVAGTANIGDVDVLTVPTDPFGANADAASATGSISAKLRFIAATGIPITGTVTVGSHAVTNAGTFATQIDGAALTALQLIDNIVSVEDAPAGSGFSGIAMLAVRQDSHVDLAADGDFVAPTIDADGGLRVSIVAGAGSGGTAAADDADFTAGTTSGTPVMGVYESTPTSVTDGDLGTVGVTVKRTLKVSLCNGTTGAELTADTQGAQDTAFTATGTTGSFPIVRASATAPTSVNADDDGVIPWALRNGSQVVNAAVGGTLVVAGAGLPVHNSPQTSDGLSTAMFSGSDGSSILVATAQVIKASAGLLYGYYFYNPEAAVTFVHFYNTAAASVTVGTTSPLFTLPLPAGAAAHIALPHGITFSNAGWSCAATTTAGGNTAPATGVSLVCWYK